MNLLLHYDAIAGFKREFYRELLTHEHLKGGQVHIQKLHFPDGGVDEEANFWGYVLEKDGTKYLLPSRTSDGSELKLRDTLPIMATDTEKVSARQIVYQLIHKPITAKFRPVKTKTFKEFVNQLSSLEHTNPDHQKLCWFLALSQMFDRANYRISTPPGFGKDSVVDTVGNLFGKAATVESPTLAKLEERSVNLKWLAINEVVDLSAENWRIIEQFLLAAGAHKPTVTKHSRAFGGVGEEIDISEFSISIMYNDIDQYPDMNKYVDFVAKDAVLDRFPAFRLHGHFTEDFNAIKTVNVSAYVKESMQDYKDLLYAFTYYQQNLEREAKTFVESEHSQKLPSRWKTNLGKLFKVISAYCDTQEEYDYWVNVVNDSLRDYREMLDYPDLLGKAEKKLTQKDMSEVRGQLNQLVTFVERNNLLRKRVSGEVTYVDVKNSSFW